MKILFLSGGRRHRALKYLLEKGEQVVAVITPTYTEKNQRFLDVITTALEFSIPVIPVTKASLASQIKNLDYDILVSCGFPFIIEKTVIDAAPYAINVHPTLLPKYRGYRSGPYIIINNEQNSGVTVHQLTEEMDKGVIYAQKSFPLSPFDTTKSLSRKTQELEPEVLYEVIQKIKEKKLIGIEQNEKDASSYTQIRTPKDSEIDPKKNLETLYHEIRACDPDDYPAFFYVDGQKIFIRLWRKDKKEDEFDMI